MPAAVNSHSQDSAPPSTFTSPHSSRLPATARQERRVTWAPEVLAPSERTAAAATPASATTSTSTATSPTPSATTNSPASTPSAPGRRSRGFSVELLTSAVADQGEAVADDRHRGMVNGFFGHYPALLPDPETDARTLRVLVLFAGPSCHDDLCHAFDWVAGTLDAAAGRKSLFASHVTALDLDRPGSCDLTCNEVQANIVDAVRRGFWQMVVAYPPAASFSRAQTAGQEFGRHARQRSPSASRGPRQRAGPGRTGPTQLRAAPSGSSTPRTRPGGSPGSSFTLKTWAQHHEGNPLACGSFSSPDSW